MGGNRTDGRRRLLALMGGVLATLGLSRSAGASPPSDASAQPRDESIGPLRSAAARLEIMELRHAYGIATDLIGTNSASKIAEGRAIYRRIFTADARIGATGMDPVAGPDAWVDVVSEALEPYNATQHLIGTQRITELQLPAPDGTAGRARMTSYLQAWHSTADDDLWLYMGTYEDELVYTAGTGWQIAGMMLLQTAADHRKLGQPADA